MPLHRRYEEAAYKVTLNLATGPKINVGQFVFSRSANQRPCLHREKRYVASKQMGIVAGHQNELARPCAAWWLLSETQLDATLQDVVERRQPSSGFDARPAIRWRNLRTHTPRCAELHFEKQAARKPQHLQQVRKRVHNR